MPKRSPCRYACTLLGLTLCVAGGCSIRDAGFNPSYVEWTHYGGDEEGTKYSRLDQINRENVGGLAAAWVMRTGDVPRAPFGARGDRLGSWHDGRAVNRRFEATPIMFDSVLYFSAADNRVLAVHPGTGSMVWAYDPEINLSRPYAEGLTSRGVAGWRDGGQRAAMVCATRIFMTSVDARLIALDASTGRRCSEFGSDGAVDLRMDVATATNPADPRHYSVTSPPAVLNDLVIVGSSIASGDREDSASGRVRAYDARTGELRWTFHPLSASGAGGRRIGGANVWSIISTDSKRNLVFLPTASAAPDHFGGGRPGSNAYANSIVAVEGATGEVVWSFQVVHHDLWDYDVAAQPVLIELQRDGRTIPAVAVATKTGMIFVLHRETGEPLVPIEERLVPRSDVPGEEASPTQPFSAIRYLMHGEELSTDSMFGVTDEDRIFCKDRITALRNEGIFTPPSMAGTLVWPGVWGGVNWGGMAWDPENQSFTTAVKRVAMVVQLHSRDEVTKSDVSLGPEGRLLRQAGTPYFATRSIFVAPSGNPCSPPPWGGLMNVDLKRGSVRWQKPIGVVPWLAEHDSAADWGAITFGGPLVTRGGIVFIAATQDDMFRAFDVEDGSLLWEHPLPAGGQASPMTYLYDGRQYVVIAAGGRGGIGSPGDWIVAFALSRRKARNGGPSLLTSSLSSVHHWNDSR